MCSARCTWVVGDKVDKLGSLLIELGWNAIWELGRRGVQLMRSPGRCLLLLELERACVVSSERHTQPGSRAASPPRASLTHKSQSHTEREAKRQNRSERRRSFIISLSLSLALRSHTPFCLFAAAAKQNKLSRARLFLETKFTSESQDTAI